MKHPVYIYIYINLMRGKWLFYGPFNEAVRTAVLDSINSVCTEGFIEQSVKILFV